MARSPLAKPSLLEIKIVVLRNCEDATVVLLEQIFGQSPTTFARPNAQRVAVSVVLDQTNPITTRQTALIEAGLRRMKNCGLTHEIPKFKSKKIRAEDWAESWKKHFKPLRIAGSLRIQPGWIKTKPRLGEHLVVLDPGLSFGTGHHATTEFCLQQLVAERKPELRQSFLDVGTGSGILAISAAKLGYSPIVAFDIDPESVRVSLENAAINGVEKEVRPYACDLGEFRPKPTQKVFSVLCANLTYDLLVQHAPKLVKLLAPGGVLILAGILSSQFAAVKSACASVGLVLKRSRQKKEWRSASFVLRDF